MVAGDLAFIDLNRIVRITPNRHNICCNRHRAAGAVWADDLNLVNGRANRRIDLGQMVGRCLSRRAQQAPVDRALPASCHHRRPNPVQLVPGDQIRFFPKRLPDHRHWQSARPARVPTRSRWSSPVSAAVPCAPCVVAAVRSPCDANATPPKGSWPGKGNCPTVNS